MYTQWKHSTDKKFIVDLEEDSGKKRCFRASVRNILVNKSYQLNNETYHSLRHKSMIVQDFRTFRHLSKISQVIWMTCKMLHWPIWSRSLPYSFPINWLLWEKWIKIGIKSRNETSHYLQEYKNSRDETLELNNSRDKTLTHMICRSRLIQEFIYFRFSKDKQLMQKLIQSVIYN